MPWVPHITSNFSLTPFYSAPNNRTENFELNLTSHIATGPPQPHSILTAYDHEGSVMGQTLGLMGAPPSVAAYLAIGFPRFRRKRPCLAV